MNDGKLVVMDIMQGLIDSYNFLFKASVYRCLIFNKVKINL